MNYLLAFDPSMTHLGYAVLSLEGTAIACRTAGAISLSTKKGQRLINALLAECKTMEGFLGITWEDNPFNVAHGRTDLLGQKIRRGQGGAVGVLKGLALAHGLATLPPVNGKSAKALFAGNGNAGKEQVMHAAALLLGVELTEHAADACAVGWTALRRWWAMEQAKQLQLPLRVTNAARLKAQRSKARAETTPVQ
jgi:Holliday junction resolvasome RuvABC endonuclease subunit